MQGDLEVITEHLNRDPSCLNRPGERGTKPFHLACGSGKVGVVKLLIDKGVDVNETDIFGKTGLHFAAKEKQFEVVKYLLSLQKISKNAQDVDGNSPLMNLCMTPVENETGMNQMKKILEEMFEKEVDPLLLNSVGRLPLVIVIEKKYLDLVPLFLKSGGGKCLSSSTNSRKMSSSTSYACEFGPFYKTPLHAACEIGHLPTAEVFSFFSFLLFFCALFRFFFFSLSFLNFPNILFFEFFFTNSN